MEVEKAEREMRQCEGCLGLPCVKRSNKGFEVVVRYEADLKAVAIRRVICKYERARREQLRIERGYGLAKIPAEYLGKGFEDYDEDERNERAIRLAKSLIARCDIGAFFFGNVGSGKSLLAAILAQEVIRAGRAVAFVTVPTLSMHVRSTYRADSGLTDEAIIDQLCTVPALFLDDVGMEKPTRFITNLLSIIINERYNLKRQTIITSNYTMEELRELFNSVKDEKGNCIKDGSRIYDRLKQMCIPALLGGGSRRTTPNFNF